ncbi:hypothetical protein ACR0ST_03230 [Aliidiomarina sp. Khilg15.8]
MGIFNKLFGGLFTPQDDQKKPTVSSDEPKKKVPTEGADSHAEGPKFSGRTEETKAQKNADPETRKIVKDAQEYPTNEDKPNPTADASEAVGKGHAQKSKEEQEETQPKPGAEQRKRPHSDDSGKSSS